MLFRSYGPEARGGASKAEVILSEEAIDYPKVEKSDILLSLTQLSCDKYIGGLKSGGILIIDESIETPDRDDVTIYRVPILDTATNKLNKSMVANIVALGVINKITNLVSKESLEKAVIGRVPKGTEELNTSALYEGYNLIN